MSLGLSDDYCIHGKALDQDCDKCEANHPVARRCNDPRHDEPCVYDYCEACQIECKPPDSVSG